MTHKDRIKWFLTLQRILKLSRLRIAPPAPALKRQTKLFEEGLSGNALIIPRQSMSFSHDSKTATATQAAFSFHQDKAWMQRSNDAVAKSASLMQIQPAQGFGTSSKDLQPVAKLDRRPVFPPILGRDARRPQVRVDQLMEIRRPPSASTATFDNFAKSHLHLGRLIHHRQCMSMPSPEPGCR